MKSNIVSFDILFDLHWGAVCGMSPFQMNWTCLNGWGH